MKSLFFLFVACLFVVGCTVDAEKKAEVNIFEKDLAQDIVVLENFRKNVLSQEETMTAQKLDVLYTEAMGNLKTAERKNDLIFMMLSIMPYFPEEVVKNEK